MKIKDIQEEIVANFPCLMTGWNYEYIIELGKNAVNKEEFKTENNIKGCQSKCGCKANKPNKVAFTADSDAILTKVSPF
jgi:sulfur transfer protein SufE